MKIAVLAHIRHPIAEPFMGGMEAHSRTLCDQLRAAGHDVVLFAAGGSRDSQLVEICPAPYEAVLPWRVWRGSPELMTYQRKAFERAWRLITAGDFDVVHNNSLYPKVMDWAARDLMPCVTSQHVPPFGAMREAVTRNTRNAFLRTTVTSQDQKAFWPLIAQRGMDVVHNGIRCDHWVPQETRGPYFTWCGRITRNKGTADAVRAASIAGLPLRLYGPVEDAAYFAEEVEPYLSDAIQYHGHQTIEQLQSHVGGASGALVTPLWDEPFGLVAAEALSAGTPVIAYDRGALREVVGDCGFLVRAGDVGGLANAMKRVDRISPDACRTRALTRFSVQTMIERYERCYKAALDGLLTEASAAFSSSQSRTTALLA